MEVSCAEILDVLKNIHFPLTKEQIIQQAIKHGISYQIIEDLKNIPERKYISSNDVIMEFCKTKRC
ncbi:MAG: hypothetical protein QG646_3418 [Euryarchaeota archaeon]|nr:hypothetical protein [Euryarchaeota archaeon]